MAVRQSLVSHSNCFVLSMLPARVVILTVTVSGNGRWHVTAESARGHCERGDGEHRHEAVADHDGDRRWRVIGSACVAACAARVLCTTIARYRRTGAGGGFEVQGSMRFGLRFGAARRVRGVGPRVESGLVYHHRWLDDDAAPAPHAQRTWARFRMRWNLHRALAPHGF